MYGMKNRSRTEFRHADFFIPYIWIRWVSGVPARAMPDGTDKPLHVVRRAPKSAAGDGGHPCHRKSRLFDTPPDPCAVDTATLWHALTSDDLSEFPPRAPSPKPASDTNEDAQSAATTPAAPAPTADACVWFKATLADDDAPMSSGAPAAAPLPATL